MNERSLTALKWLGVFVVYKLIVLGLAFVALSTVAHVWPAPLSHFVALLFEWDAKHIIRVASQGYLMQEPSIQILPVYPLLIRAFHLVIGDWNWSAFLVTQFSSFFAFFYFYKLARLDLDEHEAQTALGLFAIFPTAYFLTAPYAEGTFCAVSFATIYYTRLERYRWASFFGFLSSFTRITGLLLAPAFALHWFFSPARRSRSKTLGFAAVALAITLGYLAYLALNKYLYDEWFFYMGQQAKHWGVHLSYPFKGAIHAFLNAPSLSPDNVMTTVVMEVGFTFGAVALLPVVWKKRDRLDFFYTSLTLLLLVSMDFWLSRPRYVLVLYPLFMAIAPWFARSPLRLMLYGLGSAGLFGIYWALYLNAQWAH